MDPSKDNANPTILNPSDLPSRRQDAVVETRKDGGTGLFDGLVPAYSYLNDPFEPMSSLSSDEDSDAAEEIDEQEIFGTEFRSTFGGQPSLISCPWQIWSRRFRIRSILYLLARWRSSIWRTFILHLPLRHVLPLARFLSKSRLPSLIAVLQQSLALESVYG